MHLYFHESEIGKNFPLSYCGIKKYTYPVSYTHLTLPTIA